MASERCPACDGFCERVQTEPAKHPAPVCPGHKELVREVERLDAERRVVGPTPEQIERAAKALQERWPRLGILSRAVVHNHPSKYEIAKVALDAALGEDDD